MSSDRFGRGESPSARRRARRRRLSGLDPAPPPLPDPRSSVRQPARPWPPPLPDPGSSVRQQASIPSPPETTSEPTVRHGRPVFEWRGWDSVVTYVVLAVMLAGVITGLHRLLAAGVLVIGVSALAWAITHRPGRQRTTSSYGVLLDWLLGVLPRPVYLVLCVVVIVLGAVGLMAG